MIPVVAASGGIHVEFADEVLLVAFLAHGLGDASGGAKRGIAFHLEVKFGDGPSPGRPAPDLCTGGGVIVSVANATGERIVSRDHHDAVIVAITLKQLRAVGEERRVRQDVVLQDDAFLDLREEPFERSRDGLAATEVLLAEERLYLAGSVGMADDFPHGGAFLCLAWNVRTRCIRGDEELCGPSRANRLEHSGSCVRRLKIIKRIGGVEFTLVAFHYGEKYYTINST